MENNSYKNPPMEKEQLLQIINCIETICKTAKGEPKEEAQEAQLQESPKTMVDQVGEFHAACDQPVFDEAKACQFSEDKKLRLDLLEEEFNEYKEAERNGDIVGVADALADMLYIICGTAHAYNIPILDVFNEVHKTNMEKVGSDGKVKRREDGKILKPEGWQPPQLKKIIDDFNVGKELSDRNKFLKAINDKFTTIEIKANPISVSNLDKVLSDLKVIEKARENYLKARREKELETINTTKNSEQDDKKLDWIEDEFENMWDGLGVAPKMKRGW